MVSNLLWRDVLRNSGAERWQVEEIERLVDAEIALLQTAVMKAQQANVECMENWLEWTDSLLLELVGMVQMLRKVGSANGG